MLKKWYLIALVVTLGVGFAFTGCKKGGDPKAAEALCQKMGEEAVALKTAGATNVPADAIAKEVEIAKKACLDNFTKAPEDEKPTLYKQAAEKLEKCKDKKGEDFGKCVGE
jgi:hypothetical protein